MNPLSEGRRCRSCRAPIRFVKMEPSGAWMPLDQAPALDGNIVLEGQRASLLTDAQLQLPIAVTGPRYTSHFATCPQADQHRRGA